MGECMYGQGGRIARKNIWIGSGLILGFFVGNLVVFCFGVSWNAYYISLLKRIYEAVQSISLTESNYVWQQFFARLREILLVSLLAISPWPIGLLFCFFLKKGILGGIYLAMNARILGFRGFLAGFASVFPHDILFLFLQYVLAVLLMRRKSFFVRDTNRGIWMLRLVCFFAIVSVFILLITYLEVKVGIPLQAWVYEKLLEKILY